MSEGISKYGLIFFAALIAGGCSAPPFSQSLLNFFSLLDNSQPQGQVSLEQLRQLDPLLLRPASLYPQFAEMSPSALAALYQYGQHCYGSLDAVPAAFQ